jgi:hypothetical protein
VQHHAKKLERESFTTHLYTQEHTKERQCVPLFLTLKKLQIDVTVTKIQESNTIDYCSKQQQLLSVRRHHGFRNLNVLVPYHVRRRGQAAGPSGRHSLASPARHSPPAAQGEVLIPQRRNWSLSGRHSLASSVRYSSPSDAGRGAPHRSRRAPQRPP